MGAAGDMLTAALLELLPEEAQNQFLDKFAALGIPGVEMKKEPMEKCGIRGTHMVVTVNGTEEESVDAEGQTGDEANANEEGTAHEHTDGTQEAGELHTHEHEHTHADGTTHTHEHTHSHSSMAEIEHVVRDHLALPKKVQDDIMAVYQLIAEAESHAHGVPVSEIHFHEVGTMDAIADITAVCMLMAVIAPEQVIASPIHVGSGQVKCAHGILPVPAPATAYILREVPIYSGKVKGELCTPTGAALLKHFVGSYGSMPVMKVKQIGYGMGKKNFKAANCVRAMLGDCDEDMETIYELTCNVDDMTAERIAFATERLLEGGARDVYTISVGMKKNRPGTLIHVMCDYRTKQQMAELLFRYTTTLGVRENRLDRYALKRKVETLETPYGEVRIKKSNGYGVKRSKLEYEDLARIAREKGISIDDAEKLVKKATRKK